MHEEDNFAELHLLGETIKQTQQESDDLPIRPPESIQKRKKIRSRLSTHTIHFSLPSGEKVKALFSRTTTHLKRTYKKAKHLPRRLKVRHYHTHVHKTPPRKKNEHIRYRLEETRKIKGDTIIITRKRIPIREEELTSAHDAYRTTYPSFPSDRYIPTPSSTLWDIPIDDETN